MATVRPLQREFCLVDGPVSTVWPEGVSSVAILVGNELNAELARLRGLGG